MRKAITIKDIAREAGVSTATVSRVINNQKWVKPDVAKRVVAVMEELHYTPNYTASMMVKGQSNLILIIVAKINNPFFGEFTSVAIGKLKQAGYFALVLETDNSEKEAISFLNGPIARLADGIISVTDCISEETLYSLIPPIQQLGKPVIFVDRTLSNICADSVNSDNIHGIQSVVTRMVEHGHRRIALLLGSKGYSVIQDKLIGYKIGLLNGGIPVDESLICQGEWTEESGRAMTLSLLKEADPPTAFIAANNSICRGMLDAFAEAGLRLGTDISAVGIEECPSDLREFSKAGISTLVMDSGQLAASATDLMLFRLQEEQMKTEQKNYSRNILQMAYRERHSITTISTSKG